MRNFILGVTTLAIAFLFCETYLFHENQVVMPEIQYGATTPVVPQFATSTMLFVGDMMLARRVETYMQTLGQEYPFSGVSEIVKNATIAIANFEGTIPLVHEKTPELTFRFSVDSNALATVAETGFDVLSIANNHSYDYGESAYWNTIAICEQYGIQCVGHPREVSTTSTAFFTVGSTTVGLLFGHTLFNQISVDEIQPILTHLNEHSDIQIAYLHWGIEYDLVHSDAQELLATRLIDEGVDAVIGHHPHVVQDIQIYNGKPIFYSLGNFVFDQYFSPDVEMGLGTVVTLTEYEVSYTLIPFTSTSTRSQPHEATGEDWKTLIERVLAPVSSSEFVDTESGILSFPRD